MIAIKYTIKSNHCIVYNLNLKIENLIKNKNKLIQTIWNHNSAIKVHNECVAQ